MKTIFAAIFLGSSLIFSASAQKDLLGPVGNPKDMFAPYPPFAEISPECQKAKEFLQHRKIDASGMTCEEAIKAAGDLAAQSFARQERMKRDHATEAAKEAADVALDVLKDLKNAEPDPLGVGLKEFFRDINRIPAVEDKGPFPSPLPKQPVPWLNSKIPLEPWTNTGPAFKAPSPLQN